MAALIAIAVLTFGTPDLDRDLLANYYAPKPSKFLSLPSGTSLHYRDQGPSLAPALLLLHGTGSSLHTWEPWVEALSHSYRVISMDLPAHGLTGKTAENDYSTEGMVRAVHSLISQLGIERLVIGGNSMGGKISMAYALAYPQKIAGLVLVDSAGFVPENSPEPTLPLGFKLAKLPGISWIMETITPRSMIKQGLETAMANDDLVTNAMVDRSWHLLLMDGSRKALLDYFSHINERVDPSKITAPTLIQWGREDRMIPLSVGRALERAMPNATLVVYDDLGHIPMEEDPQRTVQDVRMFLASLQPEDAWEGAAPRNASKNSITPAANF
ncbi:MULTISPECIES: alpha/beta hydrolase [unclassified Iodidimonas]|uniref:alpha/beta fold hydrolase n=1 Tax=unclassified Iodidimonas TaxID=2626145 RepID=UPI002482AEEE|nr:MULTISPECIES: alpha/beta hydrolase [unclassified Iodidimonas]